MDITKELDLSTTRDQCTLRSRYESTVAQCVNEDKVDVIFDTLYYVGVALDVHEVSPVRRGLLLDLWDIWKNATGQSHAMHATLAAHQVIVDRLIQSFVANKFPDTGLADLLKIDASGDASLWRRALAGFFVHCAEETTQGNLDQTFIACAQLLFSLYDTERGRAQELIEAQLRDLDAWMGCRGARVYGPEEINREQTSDSGELTRTEEFALSLGHLAVLLNDRFEESEVASPSLHDIASAFSVQRPNPVDPTLFQRLLKHWAAVVPFVDRIIRKFSQFSFYNESSGYGVPRGPAPYGPECFVFVAGAKKLEQTSFLFATRDATAEPEKDGSLSSLKQFHIESIRGKDHLSSIEAKWINHDKTPEQNVLDDGLYGQTSGTGFFRLTLFEITEDTKAQDHWANGSVPAIGEFLLSTRAPSALLLLTPAKTDSGDSLSGHVLNSVVNGYRHHDDETVRSEADHLQYLPVYFLIDNADTLIPSADEIDKGQRTQLLRALTRGLGDSLDGDPHPILSSWMTRRPADVPELLRLVEDSRRFCAFPPMQDRVLKDLQRLTPALDEAFEKDFRTISLAYTNCLRDDELYSREAQRLSLLVLWNDVQVKVDYARRSAVKQHLQTRLQGLTQQSMQALDILERSCDFQALRLPDPERLRRNSESLRQLLHNCAIDVSSVLGDDSVNWNDSNGVLTWGKQNSPTSQEHFAELESALGALGERLTEAASSVFRELGVPYTRRFEALESDWAQGENTFREARRNLLEFARRALPTTETDNVTSSATDDINSLEMTEVNLRQAREALRLGFEQRCTNFEEFLNFVETTPELARYHEARLRKQNGESGKGLLSTLTLRYHPILGAVDTTCPFRNSSDAYDAAAECFRRLEAHTLMEVFNTLRPNDEELQLPHGTPIPSFAVLRCALYALADYESSHAQLDVPLWDADQSRIAALNAHKDWFFSDKRKCLVDILETIWRFRAFTRRSVAELKTRKTAFYLRMLLEVLAKQGINTQGYFEDSDDFLIRLKQLRGDLDAFQLLRGITLSEKKKRKRAERRNAINKQIMLVLDPASFGGSAFLDDKKKTDSLLRDLGQVEEIVHAVNAFVSEHHIEDFGDSEKWRFDDLPLYANPTRSIGILEVQVNNYTSESRARILQERATYLSLSGWLDEPHDTRLLDLVQRDRAVTDVGRLREIYEEAVDAVLRHIEQGAELDRQPRS